MHFNLDPALVAFFQVVLIDITLAGDNAVVIGMVARNVAPRERAKVIFWGLAGAVGLLIALASLATRLLAIIGLTLTGGILLLWVAWRLYRELRESREEKEGVEAISHPDTATSADAPPGGQYLTKGRAIGQILIADLSMSLDNVLAVAGAAREHPWVLVSGLALSVTLMGVAAVFIAKLLQRYHWIAYAGLLMIVYVGGKMIWAGSHEVLLAL